MSAHATSALRPWKLGFPVAIVALIVAVVTFAHQELLDEALFVGVAIDLAVTVPFVYWLVIRKTSIPKTTIAPVVIGGVLLAGYLTPEEHSSFIETVTTIIIPIVELTVIGLIVYKVRQAVKAIRQQGQTLPDASGDPMSMIRAASEEIAPGRAGEMVASEISMMYYALFVGQRRAPASNEFALGTKSGTTSILWSVAGMIVVEGVAVHLLVQMWIPTLAWILTALSIYTLLQVIALTRSLSRRHIRVTSDSLHMPYGIAAECVVERVSIESVELTTRTLDEELGEVALSPLKDFDKHNVIVHFNSPKTIEMMYGFTKQCKGLALSVDDAASLVEEINRPVTTQ